MPVELRRQTTFFKPGEVERVWRVVDAAGVPLGRLATEVATVLMGKHRPQYTPHIDTGDYVIVLNADRVELTGKKAEQKYRKTFSGYPGGLKTESYGRLRERRPEVLIEIAVKRMLPKNRLGRQMLKKLRVARGGEHQYADKNPIAFSV